VQTNPFIFVGLFLIALATIGYFWQERRR
jgi:hypothetical protein